MVNIGHTQLHTVPKWLIPGKTVLGNQTQELRDKKLWELSCYAYHSWDALGQRMIGSGPDGVGHSETIPAGLLP